MLDPRGYAAPRESFERPRPAQEETVVQTGPRQVVAPPRVGAQRHQTAELRRPLQRYARAAEERSRQRLEPLRRENRC